MGENELISNRKDEHIDISLEKDVDSEIHTWLDSIFLVHNSLPELDMKDVSIKAKLFGREFNAPLLIEGMTGGTKRGAEINEQLATIADELNIPMMVGSQRIAIENPDLSWTFSVARDVAPNLFLIGNIGAAQLIEYDVKQIAKAVDMIDANALAIHLNPLQESVQPEGDTNFRGVLNKIKKISEEINVPIMIKETGAGISMEVAQKLVDANVQAIDVSGLGGTSWSAIEVYRALNQNDEIKAHLGKKFWSWGIPTAASIIEVKSVVGDKIQVIASGGIRDGIDIAKSIAIGADFAGMAKPILKALSKGVDELKTFLLKLFLEIRNAVFLTGAKNIYELKNVPIVIFPPLKYWLESRKIKIRGV